MYGWGSSGAAGRMGRMLVAEIAGAEGCAVSGGTATPGSAGSGQDIGELAGIGRIGLAGRRPMPTALIDDSDVLIDFTKPEATAAHAAARRRATAQPIVIGTTGLQRGARGGGAAGRRSGCRSSGRPT